MYAIFEQEFGEKLNNS